MSMTTIVQVLLTDTAGLRETADEIEAEGVSRAKQAAQDADLVLAVADSSAGGIDSELQDILGAGKALLTHCCIVDRNLRLLLARGRSGLCFSYQEN